MAELEIAKRSIRGTLVLFIGNFAFTVASAASIILITRLLGPSDYGLYTLALLIPNLLQNFVGFGVNTAVIRYAAYHNSNGNQLDSKHFTINAIYFLWLNASIFTVFDLVLAGPFSQVFLHRPELTPLVQLMSFSILASTVLQTTLAAAIGWGSMSLSSVSQVVQSLLKLLISPLLIIVGLGVSGALAGHVVSLAVAGMLGTAILYRKRLSGSGTNRRFKEDVKEMVRFGFAPYLGTLTSSLATYYASIVLALAVNNTVFGLYQAALNFLTPVVIVSSALVNALFPAFASVDGVRGNVQSAFRHAYKFVAFLLTPILFFLVSASGLLITTFYGAEFLGSVSYLQFLALAYLPIAFGYTVHPAFFNGFGRTKLTFIMNLSAAITLVAFAPLLSVLLRLRVDGLILATFLSYFVAWLTGTVLAGKTMGATMDFRANGAILLVSALSYSGTLLVPKIASSDIVTLLAYLVVFFAMYLTLSPLLGAIDRQDIRMIELTLGELRFVGRLTAPLLRYERLLVQLVARKSNA